MVVGDSKLGVRKCGRAHRCLTTTAQGFFELAFSGKEIDFGGIM